MKTFVNRAEPIRLAQSKELADSVWLSAKIGIVPVLSHPEEFFAELRGDTLLMYRASDLLVSSREEKGNLKNYINRRKKLSLLKELFHGTNAGSMSWRDQVIASIPAEKIVAVMLPMYSVTSRKNSKHLLLRRIGPKRRRSRLEEKPMTLKFKNVFEREKWKTSLTTAYSANHKSLSDFSVVGKLGQGGFGRVYKAKDRFSDTHIALKIMKKSEVMSSAIATRQTADERLIHELSRGHPYVLQMSHAFETTQRLYLATELCSAGNLHELMEYGEKPLKEEEARLVTAEVILALEYLHGLGIIYRDLKPENVLIGNDGHIRLADFGLSKIAGKSESGAVNKTNSFCGTSDFMAPEMLRNISYNGSVDMWALGVFIFNIVSGETPFEGSETEDTYSRILHEELYEAPPSTSFVTDLLYNLLNKSPAERLGAGPHGWSDIKNHAWFASVNWEELSCLSRRKQRPFNPSTLFQSNQRWGSFSSISRISLHSCSFLEEFLEETVENEAKNMDEREHISEITKDFIEDLEYATAVRSNGTTCMKMPPHPLNNRAGLLHAMLGYSYSESIIVHSMRQQPKEPMSILGLSGDELSSLSSGKNTLTYLV